MKNIYALIIISIITLLLFKTGIISIPKLFKTKTEVNISKAIIEAKNDIAKLGTISANYEVITEVAEKYPRLSFKKDLLVVASSKVNLLIGCKIDSNSVESITRNDTLFLTLPKADVIASSNNDNLKDFKYLVKRGYNSENYSNKLRSQARDKAIELAKKDNIFKLAEKKTAVFLNSLFKQTKHFKHVEVNFID